ncbi:MAG: putative lipid II flippase FtsW [Gammaproteobacteria bacterium]|nr:putative lipid II flippase FtsW [Gammaproteobacteria bacterium]MCY4228224.1 putative lipid II flippase FtsW [Gammaproteobacteria bacterium]
MNIGKFFRTNMREAALTETPFVIGNSRLFIIVSMLVIVGLVMVFSATAISSDSSLTTNYHKFLRHLAHISVSVLAMWAVSHVSIHWLQRYCKWLMGIGAALLAVVLIPGIGVEINGSRRWINIGVAMIQPAEFAKISTIVFFAAYLSQYRHAVHAFRIWKPYFLVLGLVCLLLLLQPDLGMVMVIGATVSIMLFMAGARLVHIIFMGSLAAAAAAVLILAVDYRRERLFNYLDPFNDATGSGYQLVQSLIAIGRGEWFGVGLGNSIQKLFYLPFGENDFLIAIIGEELGSVGIIAIILMFSALMWTVFQLAQKCWTQGDMFCSVLAVGIGFQISFQSIVHVGVNIGMLPTTGLTLPFISYGGSSMLSSMIGIGLLLAIERHVSHQDQRAMEGYP